MLAIHWTPVNNTKSILKNGIRKSKTGLYCFPLTGHKPLDKWWITFFNQCGVRERKKYNGIVFRITQEDLPAYFGHWGGATTKDDFEKKITDLKKLESEYRDMIVWRMGERIMFEKSFEDWKRAGFDEFKSLGETAVMDNPGILGARMSSYDFMGFTFEDHQIVLSHSIPPERIIKVLPQGNEFGRVLNQKKKLDPPKHRTSFYQSEE